MNHHARHSAAQGPAVGLGGGPRQETNQPLLPLTFTDHVRLIKDGRAIDAFARRRAGAIASHGHSAEADLAKCPGQLASEVHWRMAAFIDVMGRYGRMNMPRGRRVELLRRVETAGAMLIALWDRLQVEVPEE
jgi:hypothetical protein